MANEWRSDPRRHRRWKTVKQQAYRRDMHRQADCWLCGKPIDYALEFPHPDAYEADHIIPVDDRPDMAFWLSNLAPSHASCNRGRGKKKKNKLDKTSREW